MPDFRPTVSVTRPLAMESTSDETVSTILLSNLHCGSCVRTIQNALSTLNPAPKSVDVSIVLQTVTVRHSISISPRTIESLLDEAGFDIAVSHEETPASSIRENHIATTLSPLFISKQAKHTEHCDQCKLEHAAMKTRHSRNSTKVTPAVINDSLQLTLSIGGMTCASCATTITRNVEALSGVSDVVINILGNSGTVVVDGPQRTSAVLQTIEDSGYDVEVISSELLFPNKEKQPSGVPQAAGLFQLTLSVGGMTCASCVNTITRIISAIPGVSDVAVSLTGNSATAVLESQDLTTQVVGEVGDAGYEAHVVSVESVSLGEKEHAVQGSDLRTVSLRIDGMTCQHCPDTVMSVLEQFKTHLTVVKPLDKYTDPILQVSYTPDAPSFTVRTIIDSISHIPSPSGEPFKVSLYHPPSLQDRAKVMQLRERRDILWRLVFAVIVAIPTFIIGIVYMSLVPPHNHIRMWFMEPMWAGNASRVEWALFFLATPVMFYSAALYHRRSIKEIYSLWRRGSRVPFRIRFIRFGSMNLLVSIGISVSYFASIALLALSAAGQRSTVEEDPTTYFDSVVFLAMFLLAGRYLEAYSKSRTADAISALGKLRPTTALLLIAGTVPESYSPTSLSKTESGTHSVINSLKQATRLETISAELLEIGDVVRVQQGSSPPADGVIVSGAGGAFDESSLTGESRLVKKQVGDQVFVATVNKGNAVDVHVEAIGGQTMLDHIVKVVQEGQTKRAPIERVADLLTGYFVPVVTLLGIITWLIWLILGVTGAIPEDYLDIKIGGWTVWSLQFAIAVFVIACPCGIGLAAPTALLVGSGLAAKFGILVRGGGEAFQEAAQLDLIVFDKTGTLTQGGEPQVTDIQVFNEATTENESQQQSLTTEIILDVAAELESVSSHPLALAILQYREAQRKGTNIPHRGTTFEEVAGRGIKAEFPGLQLAAIIGNEAWMEQHECMLDGRVVSTLREWQQQGKSIVLLATGNSTFGAYVIRAAFAVADALRPESRDVISGLHKQGIHTWMISGDNEVTAKAVARMVRIPETNVIAGVLPHEKAEKVRWLQQVGMKRQATSWWGRLIGTRHLNKRCVVAMVGDGINDAPALTAADVGIAIGSGSDVALSSASFILVSSNLKSLMTLIDLSRTVFNRVKFNFFWASVYNAVALPIAAGVIYPAGHTRLSPVWASLAMALSSVSVVLSSLLLNLYRAPKGF